MGLTELNDKKPSEPSHCNDYKKNRTNLVTLSKLGNDILTKYNSCMPLGF